MLQKRLAQISLAKQAVKGTPAAEATVQIGLLGGKVAGVEISEEDLNPTSSTRVSQYVERTGVVPQTEFDFVCMPRSIGLLLLGACGNVVTTGAGPYVHTFTAGDDLPYLTAWGMFAGNHVRMPDCKVDELELSFDRAGAVKAKSKVLGLDLAFGAAPDLAADAVERPIDGVIKSAGGLFEVDGAAAKVKSGTLKFTNSVEAVAVATQTLPDDVYPGLAVVDVSLTVVPADLSAFRKALTGSAAGTVVSSDPYIGAMSLKFVMDAATDLVFAASNAALATAFPDADPAGGPAEVTIEGKVLAPASGDPYSVVLRNAVESY